MVKKREVKKAVFSLVILAIILTLIIVVSILVMEGLGAIGIELGHFTTIVYYTVMGVSIGLGAGFGLIIAKRLFDVTFE